jgi:hypothetical protein
MQVLVLDRSTLDGLSNTAYPGAAAVKRQLASRTLGLGQLVMIFNPPNQAGPPVVPSDVKTFDRGSQGSTGA